MPREETDAEKRPLFRTLEQALDEAKRLLEDRFGEADQEASVALAQALYTSRERERFMQRDRNVDDIPYQA